MTHGLLDHKKVKWVRNLRWPFFYAPAHHRMAVSIELNDGRLFSPATAIVVVRLSAMAANAVNISHSIEKASAMSESSPLRFFSEKKVRVTDARRR